MPPRLSGVGLPAWRKEVKAAREVFAEYLRLLSQGKYAEALRLAVGPVRAAQERWAQALAKAPLFKEVSGASAKPLWRRGKPFELLAEYRADRRSVRVVALMYPTGHGGRIVDIAQAQLG